MTDLAIVILAAGKGTRMRSGRAKVLHEILGEPMLAYSLATAATLSPARIVAVVSGAEQGGFALTHGEVVDEAVHDLQPLLDAADAANRRWLALKLLESDENVRDGVLPELAERLTFWRRQVEERSGEEVDVHISDSRFGHAHTLAQRVVRERGKLNRTLSDRLDRLVLSRWLGVPVFCFS